MGNNWNLLIGAANILYSARGGFLAVPEFIVGFLLLVMYFGGFGPFDEV